MKKGILQLALIASLFLASGVVQAQSGLKTANKQYENLAYSEAIKTYEAVAKQGFVDSELLKNTGNSYYFNGEYKVAYLWYNKLFTDFEIKDIAPEYLYRYAQTLKNIGETQKAQLYLEKYALADSNSIRAGLIKSGANSITEIDKNSGRYMIKRLDINSPYTDYPNSMYDGKLMFTSARDTGNFTKRVFTWTGDAFTKLYESDIKDDGQVWKPTKLSAKVDTKYNESGSVITKDGNTMYFTRNNFNKGKRGKSSETITLLKIYRAELKDGVWTNVTELPFNSDQFSTAHPVLNANEDMLYFVSDRPGGYGSSDIWRVRITSKEFGNPENLGPMINTEGRETFPFINSNDELYFSSDARGGLGGLDVYGVKIKADGSFSSVLNVGTPINSAYDDFAYIIDFKTKQGYFASNRKGGAGLDDIFALTETRMIEFECVQKLKVIVMDSKTKHIITTAKVELLGSDRKHKANSIPFEPCSQTFDTKLECGARYVLRVDLPNYNVNEQIITMGLESGVTEVTILVDPKPVVEEPEFKENDDLFKKLNLLPIHFDFDKANVRPDASVELNKIVRVMKKYPQMKIDIRSYTDSRGNDAYNMKLSERRAKSTADWIILQGISPSRVSYKGYGETHLLNNCRNGVKCTNAEHEANRRSEFIVTEM